MYIKKSHIAAWLAAAVLAGSLMAGCGDTQTTQPKSSAGSAEQGASGSLVPALSQDELIAQSSLIIKGTVSEVSDAFQVKPETGGDASSYVDNTVRMEQTLRGQTDADTVPVLLGTAPSGHCKTHRRQSNRQSNTINLEDAPIGRGVLLCFFRRISCLLSHVNMLQYSC